MSKIEYKYLLRASGFNQSMADDADREERTMCPSIRSSFHYAQFDRNPHELRLSIHSHSHRSQLDTRKMRANFFCFSWMNWILVLLILITLHSLHRSIVTKNWATVFVVTLCGAADTHTAATIPHSAWWMLEMKSELSVSRLANSEGIVEATMGMAGADTHAPDAAQDPIHVFVDRAFSFFFLFFISIRCSFAIAWNRRFSNVRCERYSHKSHTSSYINGAQCVE